MIRLGGIRIYWWTKGFGWTMFGIGWKEVWFFGFSYAHKDKLLETFNAKYSHLDDLARRCGL